MFSFFKIVSRLLAVLFVAWLFSGPIQRVSVDLCKRYADPVKPDQCTNPRLVPLVEVILM